MAKKENDVLEDSLIREVNEDLQNEKIEKIWNKYGVYIVALVVLIVSTAVGYESISAWYVQKQEKNSDKFVAALNMQDKADHHKVVKELDKVIDETSGIYPVLAKLQKANLLLENKEYAKAIEILTSIYEDKSIELEIRNVAAVKIASYEIDFGDAKVAKRILKEVIDQNNSWSAISKDLLAILEVKQGNIEEAKELYRNLMTDFSAPEAVRKRAEEMLSVL